MIYVIWRDYDGTSIEEFNSEESVKAAEFLADTLRMQEGNDNGTEVLRVIEGEEMGWKVVEKVSKVSLFRHKM